MRSARHARHPLRRHASPARRPDRNHAAPAAVDSRSKLDVPADAAQPELTEGEGLKLLLKQFQELREYVAYYAAAKTDSVKCAVRDAIRQTVLAALGFVALAGLIVMASWLVLSGISQGAGALFGDRAWIGTLMTGALALVGIGFGILCVTSIRQNASRKGTVQKYETRNAQQRARFGRDVRD
jgi:hypothetical protein